MVLVKVFFSDLDVVAGSIALSSSFCGSLLVDGLVQRFLSDPFSIARDGSPHITHMRGCLRRSKLLFPLKGGTPALPLVHGPAFIDSSWLSHFCHAVIAGQSPLDRSQTGRLRLHSLDRAMATCDAMGG